MKTIILIGGSSSVGKTTVARRLCERLGLVCCQLDNYLQKIDDPELLFYNGKPEFWNLSSQDLFERLVKVTEQAESYIQLLVSEWLTQQKAGIIEGEKIHPRLVELLTHSTNIRGIFIIEGDQNRLYQTLEQRSQRFRQLSIIQRWRVVEMNKLYSRWLRSQAQQRQLAWINSQPWPTLTERAFAQIM
jgi:2-phosphoglycerate kinase